jgi:CBS domain containing-hemolysin-like protein
MGLRDDSPSARKIVEGLRDVIEDASISGDLDETEREIIGNVMEFRDVDVAAVMTPRTEIHAVDVEDGLEAAIGAFGDAGHSRIPVYEESIDTIIGTINALEVTKAAAQGPLERTRLRDALRPAYFVPETKHVSELLAEFRTQKQKIAIVLDEYGGTAGLVTLGDIIAEIVGDILDEYEQHDEPIRELEGGIVEVQAALHVTEVNEALDLDIPESEDFETLGGFVLAELGHFPREGESFTRGAVKYSVAEASDRRVLRVLVNRSA